MIRDFIGILDLRKQTTYKTGLLQARAYRALKQATAKLLREFNINPLDWAILGIIYENKNGIRLTDIADILGVDKGLITRLVGELAKGGWIEIKDSPNDKRSSLAVLNKESAAKMTRIEKKLRTGMKKMLKGAGLKDILGYLKVLRTIVQNSKDDSKGSLASYDA